MATLSPNKIQDFFANAMVLQDESLLDVVFLLEDNWPLTPVSLGSLASLTEAVVLHEKVYFDICRHTTEDRRDEQQKTTDRFLIESSLIKTLTDEGAISVAPSKDIIEKRLQQLGSEYRYDEFLVDFYWGRPSLSSETPVGVIKDLEAIADLMRLPTLFMTEDSYLISPEKRLNDIILLNMGFNAYDIDVIESNNHRVRGMVKIANGLNCSFGSNLLAMPHQIGQTAQMISKSRSLYTSILAKLENEAGNVEDIRPGFSRIGIPPLCQILLVSCSGSKKALSEALLSLREKYKSYRQYATDYEKAWENATTRGERLRLQKEHKLAWEELMKKESEPTGRITHTVWDIVKSPQTGLVDKLVEKDKSDQIINKVKGLHDFWEDMKNTPTPERNMNLLQDVFGPEIDLSHWNEAASLAEKIEQMVRDTNKRILSTENS